MNTPNDIDGEEVDKTTETCPLHIQDTQNESKVIDDIHSKVKEKSRVQTISTGSMESNVSSKRQAYRRHRSTLDLYHHNSIIDIPFPLISEDIDTSKVPWWTSKRFILAMLCFCGFACLYAQRVNLSIAIVSMVNHRSEYLQLENSSSINNNTTESPLVFTNSSVELKCPVTFKNNTKIAEFHWNKRLQGLILGSFFWGYLILQVPGGWLSERFGAKKVIAIGMFPVAILSLLSPVCARTSPYLFIVVRVILGLGESVMYPACQALWANWAPPSERSRLIGISYAGGQFGNALIFPIGGLLSHYGFDGGWPSVFYIIGVLGFIWTVVWCIFAHDSPAQHPTISPIERKYIEHSLGVTNSSTKKRFPTPWKSMFKSKAVWAIIVGHVCGNYGIYMLLTQLPTYMKEVLKFDIKSNGVFSMLPYLTFWFMILVSGTLADFLIRRQMLSIANTRKLVSAIGTVFPGIFLIGTSYMECDQQIAAVVMVTLAVGLCGFHISGFFINHSDIAPSFAGTLFGISNTAATIPGILAPYIVGALTVNGTREEWQVTFYVAAGVYFFGAIFYGIMGEGEVQTWAKLSHHDDENKGAETVALTDTHATKSHDDDPVSQTQINGKHAESV